MKKTDRTDSGAGRQLQGGKGSKKPAVLLAAAALLLAGSTVGSTRAALTYYSENYSAQVNMSSIGVTLVENGKDVSGQERDAARKAADVELLKGLKDTLEKDGGFAPGKRYDEAVSVKNSGNIDTFVRVILTRSWKDDKGVKDTTLSPELIELDLAEGSGWVVDESATTPERTVLYYTRALAPGEETASLSEAIRIDNEVAQKVEKVQKGQSITYQYAYDGYSFCIDAEADAVQTHNAQEAVKSAWGINVAVSEDETSLSLQ